MKSRFEFEWHRSSCFEFFSRLVLIATLSFTHYADAQIAENVPDPTQLPNTVKIRTYRVPFDSVTRMFAPGTELESIRYDEFEEMLNLIESDSKKARSSRHFLGSVDNKLEIHERILDGTTHFESPHEDHPLRGFLTIPGWLDSDFLAKSGWKSTGSNLYVANDGQVAIDFTAKEPVVRWSVSSIDTRGPLRFPVRFPQGVVNRIRLNLPAGFTPSSDVGVWIPDSDVTPQATSRSWHHSGSAAPSEIRIEELSSKSDKTDDDFDADSNTEWIVSDDMWSGHFEATLRSARSISGFRMSFADDISLTDCQVNGEQVRFQRIENDLFVPLNSESGKPVAIRCEMKRPASQGREAVWPTIRPRGGRWFLARASVLDLRENPFAEVVDSAEVPLAVSIDNDDTLRSGAKRLRFVIDDDQSTLKLRTASSQSYSEGEVSGEYLVSEGAEYASIRIDLSKIDQYSGGRLHIRSKMRPLRVISYRTSIDSQRTPCHFEINTTQDGFFISALPSDPSRGALSFDIQLSREIDQTTLPNILAFPTIKLESGRYLSSKWTILSNDPLLRLKVKSARSVRWFPSRSKDILPESKGIQEIAPNAKPIATWSSEGIAAPELETEKLDVRNDGMNQLSLAVMIIDKASRFVHSIHFDHDRTNSPNSRKLIDESLERVISNRVHDTDFLRFDSESGLQKALIYRYETFPIIELSQYLRRQKPGSTESNTTYLFLSEKNPKFDRIFRRFSPSGTGTSGFDLVAEATIDFLKSNKWLSDRFGVSGINVFPAKDLAACIQFSGDLSDELASSEWDEAASPLLTGPIELISSVSVDGSATHRLMTYVKNPGSSEVRIVPGNRCEILGVKMAGKSIPLEFDESGNPRGVYLNSADGHGLFELDFTTGAGVLESTGIPLRISFADVPTVWKIRSPQNFWSIAGSSNLTHEIRTSFAILGSHRIARIVPGDSGYAIITLILSVGIWIVSFYFITRYSNGTSRSKFSSHIHTALCFVVIILQKSTSFSVLSGAIMCIVSLLVKDRNAKFSSIRSVLPVIAMFVALPSITAQPNTSNRIVRVAIPFEKLENAFERPKRAVLVRSDLKNLRDLAAELRQGPVKASLYSNRSSHSIEPIEGDSLRIVSKYTVASNDRDESSPSNRSIVVPLASDDALQVRATLDGIEVPVRVDKTAHKVEFRFDRMPNGEITIIKTFLLPRPGSKLNFSLFPAIGATFKNATIAHGASGIRVHASLGERFLSIDAGSEFRFDLAGELSLSFGASAESPDSSKDVRSWFTVVRNSTGFAVIARLNDESRESRTLTFGKSAQLLDASDCEISILPKNEEGKNRIRVTPLRKSVRIRLWLPESENEIPLGDVLNVSPDSKGANSIIRLATGSDVHGDWSVLTDSKRFEEDPFELESAASEAEALIRGSYEIDDWRSVRLRFEERPFLFKPEIESILTLDDEEVRGRFSVQSPSPHGSSIVRETVVKFPDDTIITEITGDDLIDHLPVNGDLNTRRIIFHAGLDGIARFEIRTRTKIAPAQAGDSSVAESRSTLPWPGFDSNALEPGKLIVDRRIDPESTFRTSPIRSDSSLFENQGEIRTPETPADLRRWLYRFRGSEAPPVIGWQIPGVFSHVQVEQEVDVVRTVPQWQCRIHYDPLDGPLSTILFEIKHGIEFEPVVEPDEPKSWKIERVQETGKTRFRLRANSPTFGRSSIIVRNGKVSEPKSRFDLPSVTPLGHGKVDKSVTLRTTSENEIIPFEIEARGLIESTTSNAGSGTKNFARVWRFRAPDASLSLIFGNRSDLKDSLLDSPENTHANLIRNLAFEFTDDGYVLWFATGDAPRIRMRSRGISFPDELGHFRITGPNGSSLELERKDGGFVFSELESFDMSTEILLSGRFPIDRLPRFFSFIEDNFITSSPTSIVFALKHEMHSWYIPPGKQVTPMDWLKSGLNPVETSRSQGTESIESERFEKFGTSGITPPSLGLSANAGSSDSISKRSRPSSGRSSRFATDYIDSYLLDSSSNWNFYKFDPATIREFVRTERVLHSKPMSQDDGLRRGMIAAAMTLAILVCSRSRTC